jgi:hypothetical protein
MQLAEAQRQEQERGTLARAFRGAVVTDPATGQATVDVPRAFTEAYRTTSDPLTVFKAQQGYLKTQAEASKDTLEAQKLQLEQQLKGLEVGGQVAQGVEDRIAAGMDPQAAWEAGIATLARAGIPTQGIPKFYDAPSLAGWKGQATAIKTRLEAQQKVVDQQLAERRIALETRTENRLQRAEGRAETKAAREEREAAGAVPQYTSDSTLNVAIDQEMQAAGLPRGQQPPGHVLDKAMQRVQRGKEAVSGAQGLAGAVAKPLEGPALQRVNMLMQGEDVVQALQSEFTPEERARYVGLGGLRMTLQQAQQLLQDAQGGKGDPKFARFVALVALGKQEAFSTAGQALSAQERDVVYGYIPTGREWSAEEFEQKLTLSGQRLPTLIDRELTLSTTPKSELAARRKRGELPSIAPGSPATTSTTGDTTLTEADIAATMARSGKTRQEVLDAARKKGWTVPAH